MYCSACGAFNEDSAVQCQCGSRFVPQTVSAVAPARHQVSFHGEGGTLLGIYLVNLLLSIITLGIYSFWGRVKVRKYIYSQTEFQGDRFAYHGTGGELLRGWLKALGFFVVLVLQLLLCQFLFGQKTGVVIGAIVFYGGLVVIIPLALVGAWRYRLSRTSFRGIRFSFRGRTGEFFKIYVGGVILTVITLGFYTPYFWNKIRRFFVQNAYFGNARFAYDGEGSDLFGPYVIMLLLVLPTLGMCRFWFMAKLQRHYWSHTTFGGARFESTITGMDLFGLTFTNFLLVVFTLGIGMPWARVRQIRLVLANLYLHGTIDIAAIQQEALAASATGEELATLVETDGFDVGLGL